MAPNTTTTATTATTTTLAGPVFASTTSTATSHPEIDSIANRSKKSKLDARLHCPHARAHMRRLQQSLGRGLPTTRSVPQRTNRAVSMTIPRKLLNTTNTAWPAIVDPGNVRTGSRVE